MRPSPLSRPELEDDLVGRLSRGRDVLHRNVDRSYQRRLIEPFYTTKPSGAGRGLGLAICRDLAAEFGGDLQAHNHADGGACFVLTVPVGPAPDTAKDTPSR